MPTLAGKGDTGTTSTDCMVSAGDGEYHIPVHQPGNPRLQSYS
jgi:hypothetical protein